MEYPVFQQGVDFILSSYSEPTTVKSLLLPHAFTQRGLGQDCPFLTFYKARIIKRCYHLHCGLSPRPVWIFIHTLVVLCFRGFPEFGGLASLKDTRWLYCQFLLDQRRNCTEAITLFSLWSFASTSKAVTCCGLRKVNPRCMAWQPQD